MVLRAMLRGRQGGPLQVWTEGETPADAEKAGRAVCTFEWMTGLGLDVLADVDVRQIQALSEVENFGTSDNGVI